MPEYSSTTITPADDVKTPAMNESTSGNYTLAALRAFVLASKGLANGLASLDGNGKLLSSQLPDLADDVLVYGSYALLPSPGTAGKLYITADNNKMYRWDDALATPAYVELSVDLSDYATEAELTSVKNALSAVDHRVQNLEQAKGDYVAVDSDKGVISVPSGKGKWAVVEKLRGVSRAENQLCAGVEATFSTNGVTFTNNGDGSVTLSGIATSAISQQIFTQYIAFLANHTHLVAGLVARTGIQYGVRGFSVNNSADFLFSHTANWTHCIAISIANGTNCDGITLHPIVRDLTLYFGSTVPTLAEIQTYYPWLLSPSAYGSSLVDSVYEGVKSTSPYNIWNEEWELGRYDNSTGEKISASTSIRSKDFTYVEPNDRLYVICPSIGMRIFFYGINKNFISTQIIYNTSDFTIASGVYYFTFQTGNDGNPITTYGNNIQFCPYSYTEERDTYHHHLLGTLSLPTPITLRSAGIVAEEFDLKTGEKTNPLGSVDLGTLNWSYYSTDNIGYISDGNLPPNFKQGGNATCSTRIVIKSSYVSPNPPASDTIVIRDIYHMQNLVINATGYSSASEIKTAMNGVMLNYELATPSTPTLHDPIQNPTILTEAGGTITAQTEEPIDGNFSVGFITL